MGLFSEVKCGRCDRRYSGLRVRCPYCGVRRNKKSKRASDTDTSTAKLVIGILVLAVLIVAVIILLITSLASGKTNEEPEVSPTYSADDGVNTVTNEPLPVESPSPSPEVPDEPVVPAVESLIMTFMGSELIASSSDSYNYDVSMSVSESIQLGYSVSPASDQYTVEWSSSDESVVTVLSNGSVTAMDQGSAVLTLTVGDRSVNCIVYVS